MGNYLLSDSDEFQELEAVPTPATVEGPLEPPSAPATTEDPLEHFFSVIILHFLPYLKHLEMQSRT